MTKKNAGKLAGNNQPQNPSETTVVDKKSNRGRPEGYERPEVIIKINETYRIDLSDGMNKTVQKLITRKRSEDGNSKDGLITWKKNEEYTDWESNGFYITYKGAFDKIHNLMLEDSIKDKGGIVTVKEFIDIYKEKLKWLDEMFKSDFVDDEIVSKPKYVKKIEEKGKK
jgi:hypothetical protein